MNHSKHWLRMGVAALAISSFALMGCEEEGTGSKNKAPEIVSMTADSTSVSRGASAILIAVVTDADGDELEYRWEAESGTFSSTDNDTVTWTAGEEVDIVTITLEVNDGLNITTGTLDIGVETYVPAVQPYFVGASTCQGCHSATYTTWSETHHADAFDDVTDGAEYCMACHTTGYDTDLANGGFDDNRVSDRHGVQCESCHGPGSDHAASMDADDITLTVSESVCQECHGSDHTTFWADWAGSGHGTVTSGYPGGSNPSCTRCHSGNGFIDFASGDTPTTYTDDLIDINCVACHDPHNATSLHQIRKADSATLPDGTVVTTGGLGILCQNCHTGRRSDEDIAEQVTLGDGHFGSHHGNQGSMLHQAVVVKDVAPAGFVWSNSNHRLIEDSCATCHLQGEEDVKTGHAFEPSVEACEPCHGVIADFDDIIAKNDYDGDGMVDGVQTEVHGLIDVLFDGLMATGIDTTGYTDDDDYATLLHAAGAPADSVSVWAGLTAGLTPQMVRESAFNLSAVLYDHSYGIHNFAFIVQLLQQSYKHVSGVDVPNAHIMVSGEK